MDSNFASVGFIAETSIGVPPANPRLQRIRLTKEELTDEKETVQSQEVRPDRTVADLPQVGKQASGNFAFELSYGTYTDFFKSALLNDITAVNITGISCNLTASNQQISSTTGAFNTIKVGMTIKVTGAATAANNGIKYVVAKAVNGASITLAAGSITTNETGATLTIVTNDLRNGADPSKLITFLLERRVVADDNSKFYEQFFGMVPSSIALEFTSKQIVTGTVSFLGLNSTATASKDNQADSLGYQQYSTAPLINAAENFGSFLINNAVTTEKLKSLKLTISTGARGKDCMGNVGLFDIGLGSFEVTGTLNAYLTNSTLRQAFKDHSDVALSWRNTDSLGNVIVWTIPRIKLSTKKESIGGLNSDIMLEENFTALYDATTDAQMIINFIPAS